MPAQVIDGRALAQEALALLTPRVQKITQVLGRPPGLGLLRVGDDAASTVYLRHKQRLAAKMHIMSRVVQLDAQVSQAGLHEAIDAMNAAQDLDAMLLQLPVPKHLDPVAAVAHIDAAKEADGLHPEHVAALAMGRPKVVPCTPAGCLRLIEAAGVPLQGSHAVVVGRSSIVGRPMAQLLLAHNATVTVCHALTKDLAAHTRRADILVVAAGVPGLIGPDHLPPDGVVIDVGIHRGGDGLSPTALRGDVDFAAALAMCRSITPVPGGVGPMTLAMLMANAVDAATVAAESLGTAAC